MECIAHRDHCNAEIAGAGDRESDGLTGGELPERMRGIDHDRGSAIAHHVAFGAP